MQVVNWVDLHQCPPCLCQVQVTLIQGPLWHPWVPQHIRDLQRHLPPHSHSQPVTSPLGPLLGNLQHPFLCLVVSTFIFDISSSWTNFMNLWKIMNISMTVVYVWSSGHLTGIMLYFSTFNPFPHTIHLQRRELWKHFLFFFKSV